MVQILPLSMILTENRFRFFRDHALAQRNPCSIKRGVRRIDLHALNKQRQAQRCRARRQRRRFQIPAAFEAFRQSNEQRRGNELRGFAGRVRWKGRFLASSDPAGSRFASWSTGGRLPEG
jgi:hypothetical protein